MNEKTMTPIESMAALLAEMTERAVEAERQRDAAKKDSDSWYHLYMERDAQLKDAEDKLAAEIKGNAELRRTIEEYIETMQEGAQENG